MAKKITIEIKASVIKHYFAEKCTIQALVRFASVKHGVDVTRQAITKWIKNKLGFLLLTLTYAQDLKIVQNK